MCGHGAQHRFQVAFEVDIVLQMACRHKAHMRRVRFRYCFSKNVTKRKRSENKSEYGRGVCFHDGGGGFDAGCGMLL